MKTFITFLLLSTFLLSASQEKADRLLRRLYLDTQNRLPSVSEYYSGTELIKTGRYEKLVNDLLKSEEFRGNLATKIVDHYAPKRQDRDQHPLVYRGLEKHVKKEYVKVGGDFRKFIRDMLSADGISARNKMVLFYTGAEDSKMMAGRFTENV